ncbi:hypothetical protein CLAIMM_13130 [Cladophialophora immunda]|nr:hypothetical protein CLAIMM_13130 [Cladophialophora immunda]
MFRSALTVGMGALTTVPAFVLWTRNCSIEDLPSTDELFRHASFAKYNPTPVPVSEMRDVCVRRYPLSQIRADLVEDARRGGTALIETFNQGIWGGFGYAFQRWYLQRKYGMLPETQSQLWSKQSLLQSKYEVGTEFTDHLVVLDKTPQSILLRGGQSPRNQPQSPRDMDGLLEIQAVPDFDRGYIDFKFKSVFFAGTGFEGASGAKIVPSALDWAHKQYTKLLVESGLRRVKNPRWFS